MFLFDRRTRALRQTQRFLQSVRRQQLFDLLFDAQRFEKKDLVTRRDQKTFRRFELNVRQRPALFDRNFLFQLIVEVTATTKCLDSQETVRLTCKSESIREREQSNTDENKSNSTAD